MTPEEYQELADDFDVALARCAARAGRHVDRSEFIVPFAQLEEKLAGETVRRIDHGAAWSDLPARPLRSLRRWGHVVAAELASVGGHDVGQHVEDIESLARDDERLGEELRAALVEQQVFQRLCGGNAAGVDTLTITKAWAAVSIRARVEIARRRAEGRE